MEGKTIIFRRLQAVMNRDCWVFGILKANFMYFLQGGACNDDRWLSVRITVRAWPKSRTEEGRKLKIGWKEAGSSVNTVNTGDLWPNFEIERSKVKATRPINAVTENQPYLVNGKAYTNFRLGIRMEYEEPHGDLQPESCGWLFKSPLGWGGGISWRRHYLRELLRSELTYLLYRPHSL